jgi:DNA-binding NarL/FixJ family response regulator/anti-sigma regulatory factor (Ser/Thr protein kinase)
VEKPSETTQKRVVLVDTPCDERSACQAALSAAGWTVTCCDTVEAAIKQLESAAPDVVVAEIGLQPTGGLELLTQLKARRLRTRAICTARDHEIGHVLECLRGGAADYLRRPFEPSELVRAVNEAATATLDDEAIEIDIGEMGWIELRMPSSVRCMKRLDKFFRLLYESELAPETLEDVSLCFTEIVKNAIEWGHRFDASKRILLSHMLFQDEIVFKVQDTGAGFDIGPMLDGTDDLIAMETEREAAGKRPGGLGIAMVAGLMDSVIYNATGNMIIMSKRVYDAG